MVTQDEREFWSQTRARVRTGGYHDDQDWPAEPDASPSGTASPTLPAEMIPEPLRDWLVEVARRTCFPLEFVAIPALVAAGAVIRRSVGVMPSRYDDFLVVPNLWGAIIARPGLMKSYANCRGAQTTEQACCDCSEAPGRSVGCAGRQARPSTGRARSAEVTHDPSGEEGYRRRR